MCIRDRDRSLNPSTYLIPGPVRPKPNGIRIRSVVFPQCTGQTDRRTYVRIYGPTDRPRESLTTIGRCVPWATRPIITWTSVCYNRNNLVFVTLTMTSMTFNFLSLQWLPLNWGIVLLCPFCISVGRPSLLLHDNGRRQDDRYRLFSAFQQSISATVYEIVAAIHHIRSFVWLSFSS